MSDVVPQEGVPVKQVQEEDVDVITRKRSLETALFDIAREFPFHGAVLQTLDIHYSHIVPTAGIMFDSNNRKWQMHLNPFFFCKKLSTNKERVSVLLHEFYHITHKHPFRAPFIKINPQRRMTMNIAMDLAINQFIMGLPDGCDKCRDAEDGAPPCENKMCPGKAMTIARFYNKDTDNDKDAFIKSWTNKPWEFYYEQLIKKILDEEESGDGEGEESDKPGQGPGRPGKGKGSPTKDKMQKEFDAHQWDSNATEKDMMDATEELVKRAMQKQGLTFDSAPGFIKELLQDMDARRAQLDYKQLLLLAIKRHASGTDRVHSWTRKSRRFGSKSPGTKIGELPRLSNYIDTSGSMSVQEINDFLEVIDEFLKVGSRKCSLGLWHTDLYSVEPYKMGERLANKDVQKRVQSGGTDTTAVLKHIYENQPDLSIILTDGCYSDVDFESMMRPGEVFPTVLWIISRDGQKDHPLARLGETIIIPKEGIQIERDKQ